jgi:hypothetical protein
MKEKNIYDTPKEGKGQKKSLISNANGDLT